MSSGKPKHVLVAVLDWGLGHATRCIPVIQCLLENECRVSVAGNGKSLILLRHEFPQLAFHELPSYNIKYPSHGFFFLSLLLQSPRIFNAIALEKKRVGELVQDHQIDGIISDNRYGCYSDKVPSVFITHQLNIQLPKLLGWSRFMVEYMNHNLIGRFDECWVPDFPDSRLSGILSKTLKLKPRFIGVLSRFHPGYSNQKSELVVGLVSGPEPQREIFEKLLIKEFKKLNRPCLIVRGLPGQQPKTVVEGEITLVTHASAHELERIILSADIIVARSGYSTIMDLYTIGKKRVIFVPTPGQTEQEYLANNLEKRKIALMQIQSQFNLQAAIEKSNEHTGFDAIIHHTNLLNEEMKDFLLRV